MHVKSIKSKMSDINPNLPIISINVTGLNNVIKGSFSDWIEDKIQLYPIYRR